MAVLCCAPGLLPNLDGQAVDSNADSNAMASVGCDLARGVL